MTRSTVVLTDFGGGGRTVSLCPPLVVNTEHTDHSLLLTLWQLGVTDLLPPHFTFPSSGSSLLMAYRGWVLLRGPEIRQVKLVGVAQSSNVVKSDH